MYKTGDQINIKAEVLTVDNYGKTYQVKTESGEVFWVKESETDMTAAEAWEIAKQIALPVSNGGYSPYEFSVIFGIPLWYDVMKTYTPQQIKDKIAARKAKEEICVGDVVQNAENPEVKVLITRQYIDGTCNGINKHGETYSAIHKNRWKKTGKHIDIQSVFDQIGGIKS